MLDRAVGDYARRADVLDVPNPLRRFKVPFCDTVLWPLTVIQWTVGRKGEDHCSEAA